MSLADRIREAMGKMSAADLARATHSTQASVTFWLNGTTKSLKAEKAQLIELATGYRASWIVTGRGPKRTPAYTERSNVTSLMPSRRVPVISWVQAGSWAEVQDEFHPGEADEWAEAYDSAPGDSAFALRVVGDSMTNPNPSGRSFPAGTVIIVDPALGANAGDYVVAKDVQTQQATFKMLTTDGGRWFLKPLNPSYPTVEIDDPAIRVIGKVVEYQIRGKL